MGRERLRERAVLLVEQGLGRRRDPGDGCLDLLVEPVGHRVEPLLDDVGLHADVRGQDGAGTDPEALPGRVRGVSGPVDAVADRLAHHAQDFGIGFDQFVHHQRSGAQLDVLHVLAWHVLGWRVFGWSGSGSGFRRQRGCGDHRVLQGSGSGAGKYG